MANRMNQLRSQQIYRYLLLLDVCLFYSRFFKSHAVWYCFLNESVIYIYEYIFLKEPIILFCAIKMIYLHHPNEKKTFCLRLIGLHKLYRTYPQKTHALIHRDPKWSF